MKFVTGLITGVAIGYTLAARMRRRTDEDLDLAFEPAASAAPPSRLGEQGRRVVDLASERGVRLIRQARAGLQRRIDSNAVDGF